MRLQDAEIYANGGEKFTGDDASTCVGNYQDGGYVSTLMPFSTW
jgi:hypothetical protein